MRTLVRSMCWAACPLHSQSRLLSFAAKWVWRRCAIASRGPPGSCSKHALCTTSKVGPPLTNREAPRPRVVRFYRCYCAKDGWFFLAGGSEKRSPGAGRGSVREAFEKDAEGVEPALEMIFRERPIKYWQDELRPLDVAVQSLESLSAIRARSTNASASKSTIRSHGDESIPAADRSNTFNPRLCGYYTHRCCRPARQKSTVAVRARSWQILDIQTQKLSQCSRLTRSASNGPNT